MDKHYVVRKVRTKGKTVEKIYARASYYCVVTDPNSKDYGKKKRKYAYKLAKDRNHAREVAKKLQETVRERGPGVLASNRTTVGEYLATWLEIKKPTLSQGTYTDYEDLIRARLRPALGAMKLSELQATDIEHLYARMQQEGLSARTVRYTHTVLSSALKHAVRRDALVKNPAGLVELPRAEHREMKFLTPEQARRFLKACALDECGLIFDLALWTGMRPEEYLGLKWEDIDFARGTITVQRKVRFNRRGGGWYFGEPKTKYSRRMLVLDEALLEALQRQRLRQREAKKDLLEAGEIASYHNLGLVFASSVGTPMSIRNLERRHFKPTLKRAKLPDIRLYDLRHTCATTLLVQGQDPKTVSEWLGHSSVAFTLDTYGHVMESMKRDAAKRLGQALRG